ncbi:MAG: hypothetical protein AB1416_02900 [Actinomycetota bacterium]
MANARIRLVLANARIRQLLANAYMCTMLAIACTGGLRWMSGPSIS